MVPNLSSDLVELPFERNLFSLRKKVILTLKSKGLNALPLTMKFFSFQVGFFNSLVYHSVCVLGYALAVGTAKSITVLTTV